MTGEGSMAGKGGLAVDSQACPGSLGALGVAPEVVCRGGCRGGLGVAPEV